MSPEQVRGAELGVQAVVTGRVLRRGERLTASAELVDVQTNAHLWGERYNRTFSDIFAVEDDIAQQIATRLSPPETKLIGFNTAGRLLDQPPSSKATDR